MSLTPEEGRVLRERERAAQAVVRGIVQDCADSGAVDEADGEALLIVLRVMAECDDRFGALVQQRQRGPARGDEGVTDICISIASRMEWYLRVRVLAHGIVGVRRPTEVYECTIEAIARAHAGAWVGIRSAGLEGAERFELLLTLIRLELLFLAMIG